MGMIVFLQKSPGGIPKKAQKTPPKPAIRFLYKILILSTLFLLQMLISYDTEHDTITLRRSVQALFRAAAFAFYPVRHYSRHLLKIFWDFA